MKKYELLHKLVDCLEKAESREDLGCHVLGIQNQIKDHAEAYPDCITSVTLEVWADYFLKSNSGQPVEDKEANT